MPVVLRDDRSANQPAVDLESDVRCCSTSGATVLLRLRRQHLESWSVCASPARTEPSGRGVRHCSDRTHHREHRPSAPGTAGSCARTSSLLRSSGATTISSHRTSGNGWSRTGWSLRKCYGLQDPLDRGPGFITVQRGKPDRVSRQLIPGINRRPYSLECISTAAARRRSSLHLVSRCTEGCGLVGTEPCAIAGTD